MALERIVSGGQTGVDRAALDAAIASGVPHGGFCPRGRRAEDGRLSDHYQLEELESRAYPARTEANVVHSDGTLIIAESPLSGGTALTAELARRHGRPLLVVAPHGGVSQAIGWIREHGIAVLNVAGPRESSAPGIYRRAYELVAALLAAMASPAVGT